MRGVFSLFILHTLRALLLPLVLFFLFLYLNMPPAARMAQYNDCATGRTVHGLNSVTGKRSLHQGFYRLAGGGGVSWRVRLRSHIHLVPTLRMCGAIPPLPLRSFVACIWTTRVGIRESRLQDSETCQVWNLKSALLHCYHDKHMKHGGSG